MDDPKTKRITVGLCIPVSVELDVAWDDHEDRAMVVRGQISRFQEDVTDDFIGQHCSEEDLDYINEVAKEALESDD